MTAMTIRATTISAVPHQREAFPTQVQLTRRGRFVLLLVLLGAVLLTGVLFSAGSVATRDAGTPPATRSVVVSEGDTLWGIASEVAEPGGVRAVINDIERLNHLSGPMLVEGQTLVVPLP